MVYIFLYNVIYIKSNFSKLNLPDKEKFILIGSAYCLDELSFTNRLCFDAIHQISRDFHEIDYDEVEQIVLPYVNQYGASNITLLTNEDSTQLVCGRLRQHYNIKGIGINALLPFVNKVVSKNTLQGVVRIPNFLQFDKQEYKTDKSAYLKQLQEKLGFPMFIKPIDLVSSVEAHPVPNFETLTRLSERIISHDYEFEVDEFIDGELFHCDAMIIDGQVKFFMIGKCSFALSRFFEGKPVGSIPIVDKDLFARIENFCHKAFKKLNCFSGAYHMEVFLERNTQDIVFLEIAARTGGALITKVYERLFGINIETTNYLIQTGTINTVEVNNNKLYAGFLNFPKIEGTVVTIKKPEVDIPYDFIEYVKPGEVLEQAKNLLDISCSIIFWDESYQKIESTFDYLKNYNPLDDLLIKRSAE